MLNIVDKCNGFVIQKVTNNHNGKLIRYQTAKAEDLGNTSKVTTSATLEGARQIAGCGQILPNFVAKNKK